MDQLSALELFDQQVTGRPGEAAVVSAGGTLSYRELDARANRLARSIGEAGVRGGDVVGICLRRDHDLVVAMLAAWKAGAAYLPLDPQSPAERLRFMCADAGARLVITDGEYPETGTAVLDLRRAGLDDVAAQAMSPRPEPSDVAYLIYTSGSTGQPKAVVVEHGPLSEITAFLGVVAQPADGLHVAWLGSFEFDGSLKAILQICHGATVHIVPDEVRLAPESCVDYLVTRGVRLLQCTPSQAALLLDVGLLGRVGGHARPFDLWLGGEPVPAELWATVNAASGVRGVNWYGPTECVIDTTACRMSESATPAIGRPVPGVRVYVVDSAGRLVPPGVVGELWVGGRIARGYAARPGLTAQRFIADPFGADPGGRLYRTGDLARWGSDGTLEFVGRADDQVNLRGYRIEPGEIETALLAHPSVRAALVLARSDGDRAGQLIAYLTGDPVSDDELRTLLGRVLPAYMVPAGFHWLVEFPLTANGKIDRAALSSAGTPAPVAPYVRPRTRTERMVAQLWQETLKVEQVGAEDEFFELGGHSLAVIQVVARLRRTLGIDLTVGTLFANPTVAQFAAELDRLLPDGEQATPAEDIPVIARTGRLPLSLVQQRLWFLEQLDPDSALYAVSGSYRLSGPLDVDRLAAALNQVVARHESVRTTFHADTDGPYATVLDDVTVVLPVVEPAGESAREREQDVARLLTEQEERPFDLTTDLMLRPLLIRISPEEHVLSLACHHIAVDGWSTSVIMRDLTAYYLGETLADLDIQYLDYAAWRRTWLTESDRAAEQLKYWQTTLAGAPISTEIPTSRPRPRRPSHSGDSAHFVLPADVARGLAAIAAAQDATPFMAALAVFKILLFRYTNSNDLVVGVPVAGRDRPELEQLAGFFVNTVPVRTTWDHELGFRELLGHVRESAVQAFERDAVPFDWLVDQLDLPRDLSRNPLFQTIFQSVASDRPGHELDWGQVRVAEVSQPVARSRFDLEVFLAESLDGDVTCWLNYSTELFDRAVIERLMAHYQSLLRAVVAEPDAPITTLPMLEAGERADVLAIGRGTAVPAPRDTVIDLFEDQVRKTPDAIALVCGQREITYQQLDRQANQLAHRLIALGASNETVVGVHLSRGADAVAAAFAVWKAGAAYLALDPALPADRQSYILDDAATAILVTNSALLPATEPSGIPVVLVDGSQDSPATPPHRHVSPGSLAYVIYTSGSTGHPKGIQVEHRALANLTRWQETVTPGRRVLHVAPYGFCVSLQEMVTSLLAGHTLLMDPATDPRIVDELAETMDRLDVDTAFFTPALFAALVTQPAFARLCARHDVKVFTAGDRLVLPAEAQIPGLTVENHYGQSESHVVTRYAVPADMSGTVPIGLPVPGSEVYVLDGAGEPVPPGVVGELYLGGVQIARGYQGRADLTAERFVPDPFGGAEGQRLYRTGDLGRWGPDGSLEFLGRADDQVKIRGHRVEPGEVETVLQGHPATAAAHVVAVPDGDGDQRLVAYLTGTQVPAEDLRGHLGSKVPEYMVPAAFVWMDRLPLNSNGKVVRAELPVPELGTARGDTELVAPRTAAERRMADLWQDVLGVELIGVHDDFFRAGGHSLLATRLVSRIRAEFACDLPVRAVFEAPTVAGLTARLGSAADAAPAVRPMPRPAVIPLSYAQRRLWLLNRIDPTDPAYNMPLVLGLSGALDAVALAAALAAALGDLTARHDSLRTVFPEVEGEPRQVVRPVTGFQLDTRTVSDVDESVAGEIARGFDLTCETPVRGTLLRLRDDEHVLVVVLHHIVADGWSLSILVRELSEAYSARCAGNAPDWTPLAVQYADYTLWQREALGSEDDEQSRLARQVSYWRTELAGLPAEMSLPFDRARAAVASHKGGEVRFRVDAELHSAVVELASDCGASVFMVLQAAFAALLSRLGAGSDIVVGTPTAGRSDVALDDVVGFFVNTLVLRTDVSGDPSFAELVGRVRETHLAAYANQDVPFERLVEELNPARSLGRHPLFQVLLALQNNRKPALELSGVRVTHRPSGGDAAKFDLDLSLVEELTPGGRPAGISGYLGYSSDLFEHATAAAIAGRFTMLLAQLVGRPAAPLSAASVVQPAERDELVRWTERPGGGRSGTIDGWFAEVVTRAPDDVALVTGHTTVSFGELDRRANGLAALLVARGVCPESTVGVLVARSADTVVALLAVLKAGGVAVPIHESAPPDRVAWLLADARSRVVVVDGAGLSRVEALDVDVVHVDGIEEATGFSGPAVLPEHGAFLMYTSGSAGTPKGVLVSHRNVVDLAADRCWSGAAGGAMLFHAPVAFDVSFLEVWVPLLTGGRVVVAGPGRVDTDELTALLAAGGIDLVHVTAGLLRVVAEEAPGCFQGVREVLTGGDVVSPVAVSQVREASGVRVRQLYGPTETTLCATQFEIPGTWRGGTVPLGRPLAGRGVYVLDSGLQVTPPGVAGEIYIAGSGVARGYWGRPGLTAERFVPDPFGVPGGRMYRTGDLARWGHGGALEFLGRADDQVKIRGFRVEPAEVESALAACPGVADAAVLNQPDQLGDNRLVAYIVAEPGAPHDSSALRSQLAGMVPDYMIPAVMVPLDRLPLTPNGKLDRAALTEPRPAVRPGPRAARSPHEEILCGLFSQVLDLPRVGVDDDFFVLGGHSLLATRLVNVIRVALGVELPVRAVFETPTVAGLAERARSGPAARAPLAPADRPERIPASLTQRGLWFLDRLNPGDSSYNVPVALRLTGEVDVGSLGAAVADLVDRHESLRTVFGEHDGEPYQIILPARGSRTLMSVVDIDGADLPPALVATAHQPFDLATDIPLRVVLFRLSPVDHVLLVTLHHIAGDGWSMAPIARDLATAYAARLGDAPPQWEPLAVQYADYTMWQRDVLGAESDPDSVLARQVAFWRDVLADLPDQLDLPTDRPRPAAGTRRGATATFELDPELHASLVAVAHEHRVSLFMVLQAGLATALSRLGAGTDIPLGTAVAGRSDAALDDVVGFFVNTLVLRTDTAGDPTFAELLARVRATDLAAFANQDVPFARLVEEFAPDRPAGRHPLFQVQLVLQNNVRPSLELPGVTTSYQPVEASGVMFDLAVNLGEQFTPAGAPAGIWGQVRYDTDLYDQATVEVITSVYRQVLRQAAADPAVRLDDIDIVGEDQRHRLLAEWTGTGNPARTVHEMIEAQAAVRPHATALVDGALRLTYAELNERANRLARYLNVHGVGPEHLVTVLLPHSADLVVALLATLKAGGAYLPIDPDYAVERVRRMLREAQSRLVLTTRDLAARFPAEQTTVVLTDDPAVAHEIAEQPPGKLPGVDPSHSAYVLYTSGSTGRPKGVMVEHCSLTNYVQHVRDSYPGLAGHAVLHSTVAFDTTVTALYGVLSAGGCLHLAKAVDHVPESWQGEQFTFLTVTPSHLALLGGLPRRRMPSAALVVGGEQLVAEMVAGWRTAHPGADVFNNYGPTEATVGCLDHRVAAGAELAPGPVPVGRPIRGARVYVLDSRLRPVPPGVAGELYVAGIPLARGYLAQAGMTAERFVADPFSSGGQRMYRTGDLVRRRADGVFVFLGRIDGQVKIRGYRIETGEVEVALLARPDIKACAVVAREDDPGDKQLVAYVVSAAAVDGALLRAELADELPSYMIPAAIVAVDSLPLNRHGKLDRRALPAPRFQSTESSRAPRTDVERRLCEIFAETLNLPSVGIDDSFFDLGGHSLRAVRLADRVRSALGVPVPVRVVFEAPTVARLAASLDTLGSHDTLGPHDSRDDLADVLPIRASGTAAPLFCLPPAGGIAWGYYRFAEYVDPDVPVYALQPPSVVPGAELPSSFAEIVTRYVSQIREIAPAGPVHLLGWSFGGLVAHAVAVQLQAQGVPVPVLALLDSYPPHELPLPHLSDDDFEHVIRAVNGDDADPGDPLSVQLRKVRVNDARLGHSFVPELFHGDVVHFCAGRDRHVHGLTGQSWRPYADGECVSHVIDTEHERMTHPGPAAEIAAVLDGYLRAGVRSGSQ